MTDDYYAKDEIFIGDSDFDDVRSIFNIFFQDSTVCQSFFSLVLCFYEFPPCDFTDNGESELIPICLERCPEIQAAYEHCFKKLNFNAIDTEEYPSLLRTVENFNCSLPERYYDINGNQRRAISDSTCSKWLLSCMRKLMCINYIICTSIACDLI